MHGARVALVVDGTLPERVAATEADVVVSAVPGAVVGVYTADCVPILIADDEGRVAAAHAGWRGTVAGVANAAVEALVSIGARRERLRAALGPSICAHCFEVGDEVAAAFDALAPSSVIRTDGKKPHVDLWEANRLVLAAAGMRRERHRRRAAVHDVRARALLQLPPRRRRDRPAPELRRRRSARSRLSPSANDSSPDGSGGVSR